MEWNPTFTGDGGAIAFFSATARRQPLPAAMSADGKNKRLLAEDRIPKDFPADRLVAPKRIVLTAPDGARVHCQLFESSAARFKKPAGPKRGKLFVADSGAGAALISFRRH